MAQRRLISVLGMAVLVAACAGSQPSPEPADDTLCAEWINDMTPEQQTDMATDMLAALWRDAGSAEAPPSDTVEKFDEAITHICDCWPRGRVDTAGASLYGYSKDEFRP